MKAFTYERAATPAEAAAAIARTPNAKFIAGGTNLLDLMKLQIETPQHLIDVNRLGLDKIEATPDGGLRIGALVRNTDLAADARVRRDYGVLSRALLAGASGQLRNKATTAGNLLQRTRCVYFQDLTTPCNKRVPGSGCSAVGGYTRYHAILGASEHCLAVHPSDMAVAMAALDARVVYLDANGEGRLPLSTFYRLPGERPELDTTLPSGALTTAVEIPPPPEHARSTYRKVRDHASYAFALTSVAAEVVVTDGTVSSARIALGGVAHQPWRARRAEQSLIGGPATEDAFGAAADAELAQARPLAGNEFKVELTRRAVVATLLSLVEGLQ